MTIRYPSLFLIFAIILILTGGPVAAADNVSYSADTGENMSSAGSGLSSLFGSGNSISLFLSVLIWILQFLQKSLPTG